MRTRFFKPSPSSPPQPPSSHTSSSESLMEEKMEKARPLIEKWNPETHTASYLYYTMASLFRDDRTEAKLYMQCVKELQSAMRCFVAQNSNSQKLVEAHNLLQVAMERLQMELHQILKINREYLDAESVSSHSSGASARSSAYASELEDNSEEDEFRAVDDTVSEMERASMVAMADLKAIADCMISSGYGKECVKTYTVLRKSIVDEALYHLGVENLTHSQVQKMPWEVLELKIRTWVNSAKVAVKTLFYGERVLCDHVFATSNLIRESCFTEIVRGGALQLFRFPEAVARCKKSPEKIFRALDLYEAICRSWPEIESIFSFDSTAAIRAQAETSLLRLRDAIRAMLDEFEAAMQKDASVQAVPCGGVHPLTRYVMNFLAFLGDYDEVLDGIISDRPHMPESYFDSGEPAVSARLAWFVLLLLCKLDGKAQLYNDVALSYLFLANNVQYAVVKVRTSNLLLLLGEDWVEKHEAKAKQYAASYKRTGWSKVLSALPDTDIPAAEAGDRFARFNLAFEEVYRKQSAWDVPDPKLRDEIRTSVARRLVPAYRALYERHREACSSALVRFAPEDLTNYLSDLFYGQGGFQSVTSSSSRPGRTVGAAQST